MKTLAIGIITKDPDAVSKFYQRHVNEYSITFTQKVDLLFRKDPVRDTFHLMFQVMPRKENSPS